MTKQHGPAGVSARNTAMIESASSLPPIIGSDLFGVSTNTADNGAGLVQDSWTDYLAACQDTEEHRPGHHHFNSPPRAAPWMQGIRPRPFEYRHGLPRPGRTACR